MKSAHVPAAGFHPIGRGHTLDEKVHDTYKCARKLAEPTVCPRCGAVYHRGRWQWLERPAHARETLCPACHRIADRVPAGFVFLSSPLLATRRTAIERVVRDQETRENTAHALERIIALEEHDGGWLVTTTDIHLARRIGEALHRSHGGELELHYNRAEKLLRVYWTD